ncbi:MAG TPA: 50S ribosomal protein L29 [Candidatus Babeliales bacterium]|nr:50S ribosomal protein L29 [Candidatus Babeliales bacterium]
MKQMGFMQRVQQLSIEDLQKKLDSTRQDLFGLRLNTATSQVKDCSQYKKLRRQAARLLTAMQSKKAKSVVSKQ